MHRDIFFVPNFPPRTTHALLAPAGNYDLQDVAPGAAELREALVHRYMRVKLEPWEIGREFAHLICN